MGGKFFEKFFFDAIFNSGSRSLSVGGSGEELPNLFDDAFRGYGSMLA